MRKYAVIGAILVLLASAIALSYYLAESNLLFYATGVFWYGAIAGFSGCLFLVSLILTIPLMAKIGRLTKKHGLVFSMLISSGSVAATFYFYKPGDSDIWWYGAIAGYLGCLLLVFMVLIGLLLFKLKSRSYP